MKKLNTLVDDIYSKLEILAAGGNFDIDEDTINKFVEDMKKAILEWANPSARNSNFSLRMSNLGKPVRQLWFEANTEIETKPHSPSLMIKFLYGHLLEEVLLMLVRASGHTVTDEQKEVSVDGIKGHIDCKIDGEVVDIKTASRFAFNKFSNGLLFDNDHFGYLSQLAGYEEAEGTNNGGFLVINKESGELCCYVPEDLEKPNIKTKIREIKSVLKSDKMPEELCYPVEEHGAKGNMKIGNQCNYCQYKYTCFKDSNDGKGLRGFKYAKGVVYLTKVVDEPKVEEVL